MKKTLLTGLFLLVAGAATVMAQSTNASSTLTATPAATEVKSCSKGAEAKSCSKAGEAKACCSKDKAAASNCAGHGTKAEATKKEETAAPKE